ncbi:bifunctional diguanylate cyclase/phosphodiesterase [Halomonas sp. YLGW01]|uniref:bifunctional diguanylate cyclase/phosphodiesterase n=1 Tax=Halomonas sp. YLGW01 TaxID=2773308 RepID=UPI001F5BB47D|nr:bifunctional diguanylate cyclase/phosphodiesterase [Halomonas sp. YLGW01]
MMPTPSHPQPLTPQSDAHWLDHIIKTDALTVLFQPIVDGESQRIFGYEALIRGPSDSPLHSPLMLFGTAEHEGRLVELDLLCRRLAIQRFVELDLPADLFLNVMPATILERDFREGATIEYSRRAGLSPKRVVIELTEHAPIHDYELMRRAVAHYRDMGFRVALDDLGAGYSGLRHWAELRPDFVKIDRHFIEGIDQDSLKQQFLRSIVDVSRNLDCRLIAEGIETREEYHTLWEMQVTYLQGYHFARPSEQPSRGLEHLMPTPERQYANRHTAASICRPIAAIDARVRLPALLERFKNDPGLRCVALISQERPVGVIRRNDFLTLFANPFGHSLYAKSALEELADKQMIVARQNTPLEQLSQWVTETDDGRHEDFVIVDDAGHYLGMGNIIDLLREITAHRVRLARHANPLTGLPGNALINDALATRLAEGRHFVAAYCDLDQFKAYNDGYGYAHGDEVIIALATLLQTTLVEQGHFIGHIGGDDFMLLLSGNDWQHHCRQVLERFESMAPDFYRPADREAGGLEGEDRQGHRRFFPFISLSIAALPVPPGSFDSAVAIADRLSELKRHAKRTPGNHLLIERRHR